ncbi:BON1-associated protein 2-like [Prosopis cineraria]|uniref:BON1-associated protein 2-like n=1 Tax=Prosopis cineraria TaxID=364024 RepID=UPI00240EE9FA|nr:BON1-associated protein 2-like [Prosopis cineraria]XP_054793046.1 BON1-associated protein 2-like [Prosopis cineraria]
MHAQASSLTLEVTVLSADNLRVDRTPVTNNVYVVVRAESINSFATGMVSATTSQFLWNDKFLVDMAVHTRSITFEVKHKTAMGVVKNVGVARIAVSDFLGGGGSGMVEDCSKVLSYRLRDGEGWPNGVINFEVKVLMRCSSSKTKPVAAMTGRKVSSCGFQMRASTADQMKLNGVVIGVPTCWNPCTGRNS